MFGCARPPASPPAVVAPRDVGRRGPAGEPCLADEPRPERIVAGKVLGEVLDGDVATELLVVGEIDRSHAAAAELALDPVAARGECVHQSSFSCRFLPWPLPWFFPSRFS